MPGGATAGFGPSAEIDAAPSFNRPATGLGAPASAAQSAAPGKGMRLGASKKAGQDFINALIAEGEAVEAADPQPGRAASAAQRKGACGRHLMSTRACLVDPG